MVGAATAARLAEAGLGVVLVDQAEPAAGASGGNHSLVLWGDTEPGLSLELTRRAWDEFPDEAASLGGVGFRPIHTLGLIRDGGDPAAALAPCAHLTAAGFVTELVDISAVRELEPYLDTAGFCGALLQQQAALNPFAFTLAWADRARAAGAELVTQTRVTGIERHGGQVTALRTTTGRLAAGLYVLAAGAWTRPLALSAGVDLPQWHIIGEACVTEALPPLVHGLVGVIGAKRVAFEGCLAALAGEGAGMRLTEFGVVQSPDGNLIIGQVSHGGPGFDVTVRPSSLRDMAAELLRHYPRAGGASLIRAWARPVPFTPDHQPIIGCPAGLANLFIASGLKSTIIITPLLSKLIAASILGGGPGPLAPFSPRRFEEVA